MSRFPLYYNVRFPRVKGLKFRLKSWMLPMFKNSKFEGFDRECCRRPFKTMFLFAFFVERVLMISSHMLWNKFQDYQLRFI